MLILYPDALLNSVIAWVSFSIDSLGFIRYTIMLSANRNSFTSFPIFILPFAFSYLIALAFTSSKILNTSGGDIHPCLFPDFSVKTPSVSLWRNILALGLKYIYFVMLREDLSLCFCFFPGMDIEFCWRLFHHLWIESSFVLFFSLSSIKELILLFWNKSQLVLV